jgi:hypothetical protein
MTQLPPSDIVRQASTWSILWGILLIIFGMLAVGSSFLAAVAVNVIIAWLIVLAGVVHLILAFHAHRAGSLIWKLLVGLAYLFFGVYLIMHPVLGVASLTLLLASLFLVHLGYRSIFQDALSGRIELGAGGRDHYPAIGADDLRAMAVEFCLGNRHLGRREHDHQRRFPGDAVVGGAQRHHQDGIVSTVRSSSQFDCGRNHDAGRALVSTKYEATLDRASRSCSSETFFTAGMVPFNKRSARRSVASSALRGQLLAK